MDLFTILPITQVIFSLFLIFFVLVQNKNVSLNLTNMWGGMWPVTKRGWEKVLHRATILFGFLFAVNSLIYFLYR